MADFANISQGIENLGMILRGGFQLDPYAEITRLRAENATLQQQVVLLQSDKDKQAESIHALSAHVLDLNQANGKLTAQNKKLTVEVKQSREYTQGLLVQHERLTEYTKGVEDHAKGLQQELNTLKGSGAAFS